MKRCIVVYLTFIFLGFLNYALNLLHGMTNLVVNNGDAVGLSSGLVRGRDVHNTVLIINIKGNFNLRGTTRRRGNARQLKLAEQFVVLRASTFSFVHLNKYTGLIVRISGENFGFFGGNVGVTLDESGHDSSGRLDTEGKRGSVGTEEILSLLRGVEEAGGLGSGTIGNSLIRVDAFVELLAVEEVGNKLDDTGNTSGTTNQNYFMDVRLVDLGVTEDIFNKVKSTAEEILAELFETVTSDGTAEIDTLEERVDFDGCLGSRRKGTLSTFASSAETTNSTGI